jgi:hypothetical protein
MAALCPNPKELTMKRNLLLTGIIGLLIVFAVSVSRGDNPPIDEVGDSPVDDTTEPITGTAVMPQQGSENPMKDPFTPYDIGGAAAAWNYDDLTDAEKAVVDHGRADDQTAVQAAYAEASMAAADAAKAQSAQIQIGADLLGDGVVP